MIGLTGGIGAGKSTVAHILTELGAVVIDADLIAREVVAPGTPALEALAKEFGNDLIAPDGTLIRAMLAERAFASDERRKALEAITHPAIAAEFLRQLAAVPASTVVIHDVPLLVESVRGYEYGGIIVVEAPVDLRLERLASRGVGIDDALRRIKLQASDSQRREVATWLIDNSGDREALVAKITAIWPEIVGRASLAMPDAPEAPVS